MFRALKEHLFYFSFYTYTKHEYIIENNKYKQKNVQGRKQLTHTAARKEITFLNYYNDEITIPSFTKW